jgi:hypothetical protein
MLLAKGALVAPHYVVGHVIVAGWPEHLTAQGLPRTLTALMTHLVMEGIQESLLTWLRNPQELKLTFVFFVGM